MSSARSSWLIVHSLGVLCLISMLVSTRRAITATIQVTKKTSTPNALSDNNKSNLELGQRGAFHSFAAYAWPSDSRVPVKLIRAARKTNAEFSLYPLFPPPPASPNDKGLADGWQDGKNDTAHYFKEKFGTRLVLEDGPFGSYGEMLLSRVNRHKATTVNLDLTHLRTGPKPGIGLNDTIDTVLKRFRKPSYERQWRGYRFMFYFGKNAGRGKVWLYDLKCIVLTKGRVVEIWMGIESNERTP